MRNATFRPRSTKSKESKLVYTVQRASLNTPHLNISRRLYLASQLDTWLGSDTHWTHCEPLVFDDKANCRYGELEAEPRHYDATDVFPRASRRKRYAYYLGKSSRSGQIHQRVSE
jgi:hypothetical protein